MDPDQDPQEHSESMLKKLGKREAKRVDPRREKPLRYNAEEQVEAQSDWAKSLQEDWQSAQALSLAHHSMGSAASA